MTDPSAATLRSRYLAQAASDLEENRRRQQDAAERLRALRQEEALLLDIMSLAEHYPDDAETPPLPEQAQDEPVLARARRRGRSAPEAEARPAGAVPAVRAVGAGGKGKRQGKGRLPLLGDVLMELLAGHDGPCPAKDLRDELMVRHPDREPTPQVVRNTLESLVAKGRVERHKEERTVTYTLVGSTHRVAASGGSAS